MPKSGSPLSQEELYEELINSIPVEERACIVNELDSPAIILRAKKLKEELAGAVLLEMNPQESRALFLAASRLVRDKQISMAQLASIHILDSAIHTLLINPSAYLLYEFIDANSLTLKRTTCSFGFSNLHKMPMSTVRFEYKTIPIPKDGMSISQLPLRMQKPLVQRFFNLNAVEWDDFCEEMAHAPKSEQIYCTLVAPSQGCWSNLIFDIQKILKCMRMLDYLIEYKSGFYSQNIMLVPSFTMFQAALNAKGRTLRRKPIELIPTYGYIEAEHYACLKASGKLALALYLPEENKALIYKHLEGRFKGIVDGHFNETAFGGSIHDVYHAMREMSMTENVARARMHLAEIAKKHPKNKINPDSRPVDEILIDGELIFSYPPALDTMFDHENRPAHAESFGNIFYTPALRELLHHDLKHYFIEDMVINVEMWQKEFSIGRLDLLEVDQAIYDGIKKTKDAPIPILALTTIGIFNPPTKRKPLPPTIANMDSGAQACPLLFDY